MSLKQLQTRLSLQGALSGSTDITSEGVIKKFSLGGFSDNSNGISDNSFVAPLIYTPSAKNTAIFSQKVEASNLQSLISSQIEDQPPTNNQFSINSSSPEPLAIFSFTKNDVPPLLAAIYQAYFEDKCSLEFSKALIKKVKQENESVLSAAVKKVEDELLLVEKQLETVEKYLKTCLQLNNDISSVQQSLVTSLTTTRYSLLTPDKLGLNGRGGGNAISLLSYVGISLETLRTKSNTAIMSQLLHLAAKQMTNGASTLILGDNTVYPGRMTTGQIQPNMIDVTYGNDSKLNLKTLSLSNNVNQSFVYPDLESVAYTSKLKTSLLKGDSRLQKAAYLMTMLANEMCVSTGLGRLEGTSLGSSFAPVKNYRQNFWGADERQSDATTEASVAGSLNDYFVVNEQGQNRLTSEKGVLLFDGTNFENSANRKNVFDAFVIDSIRSPTNRDKNKVQQYSDAQQAAISKFSTGEEFFKVLSCRDDELKMLTPRGLFSRLIKDLAEVMSLLSSKETAKGQKIIELCLLSILGKESSTSIDNISPASVIKRSLLAIMVKKSMQLQYTLGDSKPKSSASESQKPKSSTGTTGIITKDKNGTVISDVQVEVTEFSSSKASSTTDFSFNPDVRNPRYSSNDSQLYKNRFSEILNSEINESFTSLPSSDETDDDASYSNLVINTTSLYENLSIGNDGLIDKLVKIYIDLCDESLKICSKSSASSSPVDPNGLTKNTQLDATLMMAMILESACLISSEFVKVKSFGFSPFDVVGSLQATTAAYSAGLGLIGVTATEPAPEFSPVNRVSFETFDSKDERDAKDIPNIGSIKVRIGAGTPSVIASQAILAIIKASEGNNIESALLDKNGNLIIPEMDGALTINTAISYDEKGQTTPASIIDTIYDLVFERELPALCFASVSAMIDYFHSVSTKYKDLASQLIGNAKQVEEIKLLSSFAQTNVGVKFLSSLNDFSIQHSRRRIRSLKNELLSDSGRSAKLTLGEFRCIQLLLSEINNSNNNTTNFVVVALPKDFVVKSLNKRYSVSFDVENPLQDETANVAIQRMSLFSNSADVSNTQLMIRSPFTSESFSLFSTRYPTSLIDILSNVKIDGKDSGTTFLQKKLDTDYANNVLLNELTSYLLKKMFSVLSSADLFAENISEFDVFPVDLDSASTAKNFARAYSLAPGIFDAVFSVTSDGTAYINEDRLTGLSKVGFDIANSTVNVGLPPLKFGEAELFYDVFQTVYFQPGAVGKRIFAPTLLDETMGFVMRSQSNPENGGANKLVTMNGIVELSEIQKNIRNLDTSKPVPSFDTYNVDITAANPLVNR